MSRAGGRPGELLEVEGVASALLVKDGDAGRVEPFAEKLPSLIQRRAPRSTRVTGVIVALVGWGLLSGRAWARVVGITLAALSAIANFLFLPYYPFWSLLIIALNVFVIWAIAAHGGEMREAGV